MADDSERAIRIRCICPDPAIAAHDHDEITFPERLGFPAMAILNRAIRYEKTLRPKMTIPETLALMADLYLRYCLESWTLVQADPKSGKPVAIPLDQASVERYLMAEPDVAIEVSDFADDLFGSAVLGPLVAKASASSGNTSTERPTSPTPRPGARPTRKRSSRSSIASIPTAAIEATG